MKNFTKGMMFCALAALAGSSFSDNMGAVSQSKVANDMLQRVNNDLQRVKNDATQAQNNHNFDYKWNFQMDVQQVYVDLASYIMQSFRTNNALANYVVGKGLTANADNCAVITTKLWQRSVANTQALWNADFLGNGNPNLTSYMHMLVDHSDGELVKVAGPFTLTSYSMAQLGTELTVAARMADLYEDQNVSKSVFGLKVPVISCTTDTEDAFIAASIGFMLQDIGTQQVQLLGNFFPENSLTFTFEVVIPAITKSVNDYLSALDLTKIRH